MRKFAIVAALALCACSKPEPEIVLVEPEPQPIEYPAECVSDDPAWVAMPDSDLDKKTLPRITKKNETNYSEVLGKRRVCKRALIAQSRKVS